MAHMTRAEIIELQKRFVDKERSLPGYKEGANTGTQTIAKALETDTASPVSVQLRNFGRVLKHYLDEARNPKQIDRVFFEFNSAVMWSTRGMAHDQAIRRARVDYDESKNPELVRQKELQKDKQRKLLEDNRKRMDQIEFNANLRPYYRKTVDISGLSPADQERMRELSGG